MPRPRSLTPQDLAAAALRIVDREGLALLSMRTVAGELGVGAMSLYRYVANRDALEALVVDEVLRDVDTDVPAAMPWDAAVRTLAERVRGALRRHPAVVPLLLTRRHRSDHTIRWGEAVLRALAHGGFAGAARAVAFRTILSYVIGAVQVEHLGALSGPGTTALAALPRAQFPFLSETARHARRIDQDREFAAGLDAVLAGLATTRKRTATGRSRRRNT
jgi:AcrR family transcriptional regulator